LWTSNPTWGKPRIQAELRKIGIEVSDSTVSRYRPPQSSPPCQSWRAFLDNDCPDPRPVEPPEMGDVVTLAQVGGLHHRYARRLAA